MKKTTFHIAVMLMAVTVWSCGNGKPQKNCVLTEVTDTAHVPARIISAAPLITEVVYALGIEDRLVGRTNYCSYPPQAQQVTSIGNIKDPSLETIVSLKPDLMITSTHFEPSVYEKLVTLGIHVQRVLNQQSIEGAYETIRQVGKLTGAAAKADSLVEAMERRKATILKRIGQPHNAPTVYYVVGFGKNGDFTAGGDTFISHLVTLAGGQNIAHDIKGWRYNLETLMNRNPDIILIRKDWKEAFCKQTPYSNLTAVKNGRVYEIDHHLFELNGPRIMDGLEALVSLIHGQASK